MHDAPTGLSRHIRTLADRLAPGRPDGELLAAWHARRDEAAFAELVRRHGRLVWGVCRRATADADDAYQAVFLLLARRAGRLSHRATVAPWLYLTARRVGQRANRSAARRRAHETAAAKPEAVQTPAPADWRPAFDAVLAGLPARYRDAVVLCELGGLPRAVAAERLGVPVGTLASRLAAARVLLRRRLARQGLTAGVLTVAGLPPAVTAGVASAAVHRLSQGVTAMLLTKVLLTVTAGTLATATVGSAVSGGGDTTAVPAPQPQPAAPARDPKAEAMRLHSEGLTLSRERKFPQAVAKFTESIRLNPEDPDVYSSRSQVYTTMGEYKDRDFSAAAADLTKYLSFRPDEYGARFNRAQYYIQLKRRDEAISDFSRILDGPTDWTRMSGADTPAGRDRQLGSVRYYRGCAFWGKQDWAMAIADFTAAERLDPKMGEPDDGNYPQWHRGNCHQKLKQYAKAAEAFAAAVARNPKYSLPLQDFAWLLATCPDPAVRDGRRATELAERALAGSHRGFPDTLEALAAAHAEVGDCATAVRRQREAITTWGDRGTPAERKARADRLAAYQAGKPWREE